MKTYLVGGAVRDEMLGRTAKDRDYVVVGATSFELVQLGFEQVGADFPVFLHPETGDEYALARRERKTGVGYVGFETDSSADVTLEEDLLRRDLTVNSMALRSGVPLDEGLVDPFNGAEDLQNRVLRHTSDAFAEDPVRVLRLARFRARFGPDWTVAPETAELVYSMGRKGVLDELTPERVWKELSRALMEGYPRLFFDTLLECDVLKTVFPEVYRLRASLESMRWHPEGNAYEHTMLVLTQAASQEVDLEGRFAALVHDFGKGLTPVEEMPRHYGHEQTGVAVVRDFANRLAVPAKTRERAEKVTRFHMHMHKLTTMKPRTVARMFDRLGALNDPQVVTLLWQVGRCDARGRLGSENADVSDRDLLLTMFDAFRGVQFADVFPEGETNSNKVKQGFEDARTRAVAEVQ